VKYYNGDKKYSCLVGIGLIEVGILLLNCNTRVPNKRTTLLFRTFCYFKREEVTLSFSFEITKCPE
jgi:hypothetical protein